MARVTYTKRNLIFGRPCQRSDYQTVLAWNISVVVHPLVKDRFLAACVLARQRSAWTPRRIDSYNCRPVRNSINYSLHSYGLAWDFFDLPYPQQPDVFGPTNAPDEPFRQAFREFGFAPGADFSGRKDYPHIEWADGLPAPLPANSGTITSVSSVPQLQSPLFTVEFVYDVEGKCKGYYFVSVTGEIHTFGDGDYVKYHGRSEAPRA